MAEAKRKNKKLLRLKYQRGMLEFRERLVIAEDYKGLSWRNYSRVAELTGKIDFGCSFKDGKCKGRRSVSSCCCGGCGVDGGYLKLISPAGAKVAKKLWDQNLGFWRPDKGCILPRRHRSPMCLFYNCGVKSWFLDLLQRLINSGKRKNFDKKFNKVFNVVKAGLKAEELIK